jgi:hypothetical protein
LASKVMESAYEIKILSGAQVVCIQLDNEMRKQWNEEETIMAWNVINAEYIETNTINS